MKKLWIKVLVGSLITVLLPVMFILFVYAGAFGILQSEKELQSYKNAAASVVLSREGELIGKIFIENRTNILYSQVPAHLVNALVATEDARYFEHRGIDSRSLLRVFFKTILFNKQGAGGGSTISQQLAKNMFGRKNKGLFAIFINKTKEILLAHRLEKVFTKQEILTLYFNTVPFGENVFGIEAAARRYFNKKVELLDIEESAVLVGILKANNLYNPRLYPENAKKRRNIVLRQMQKYNYLKAMEADSLCKLPLKLNYLNLEAAGPADYFLYQVKNEVKQILQNLPSPADKKWDIEADGLMITTTLNLTLQEYANESFHEHMAKMQKRLNEEYERNAGKKFVNDLVAVELTKLHLTEKAGEIGFRKIFDWDGIYSDSISMADSLIHAIKLLHAGLLAINPVTGAINAWVGGIDFRTQPYDQILARRQMGSTFKPILYAEALEEGIKPCYYLDNDSIVLSGYEEWSPRNYDHTHGGKYSLAGALVHSMNIPTFNLFLKVAFGRLDSLWRKMGFSFVLNKTPSLAIGTAEASLEELAIACATFPNGGYKITPQKIISIKSAGGKVIWQNELSETKTRILSKRTCQLMDAILQKAVREGTGSPMHSVYGVNLPLAGKTGTTQDNADAWFVAFNPELLVVSRVGASIPSIHFKNGANGSGSALALPLVALTLKKIQMDPELRAQFITSFPALPPSLEKELECPDYRERNAFENFIKIFKRDKINFDTTSKGPERKRKSFFRRIFGPSH